MIRVLALDPGQRVGWAKAEAHVHSGHSKSRDGWPRLIVEDHGIAPLRDAALAVHKAVVLEDRVDVVVMEKFILTARGAKFLVGDDLQTSQFVGMVRQCCWLNPRVKLVEQMPAAMATGRKALRAGWPGAADIRERLAKLPKSHDESHDGSALLHLAAWFHRVYA